MEIPVNDSKNGIRTRQDVWKLSQADPWHPVLLWYARAVTAMQGRAVTDPTSWRYQAAIHEHTAGNDPMAAAGETLPSKSEQNSFWTQCQHNSWFFFPFHRAYLLYFERIVADTIRQLGGPSDWALPYWNYSDQSNEKALYLPPAFRAAALPDGSPNPLRLYTPPGGVPTDIPRSPNANLDAPVANATDVDLSCLLKPRFTSSSVGGQVGLGGPGTWFNHSNGHLGACESRPHGTMHVAVGGTGPNAGWMSNFTTAGLDPIFWLHHCNIDRLWEVWLRRSPANTNPAASAWRSVFTMYFHDFDRKPVAVTSGQLTDTAAPLLGYRYEDVSDPYEGVVTVTAAPEESIPEMVGATSAPVTLSTIRVTVKFDIHAPTGPAAKSEAPEVHLNLENITAVEGPTESYLVFVNLPSTDAPENRPDLEAGIMPLFGVVEASRGDRQHTGDGLSYSIEITSMLRTREWRADSVELTFLPHERPGVDRATVGAKPVTVGRVSLYYA